MCVSDWIEECDEYKHTIFIRDCIALQVDVEVEFELGGDYETVEELEGMTAQSLCSRGGNNNTKGFGLMVLASDDLKERSAVFFKIFKGRVNGNVHRKVALCVDQSR